MRVLGKRIEQRGFTIEKLELRSQVPEELIDQYPSGLGWSDFLPTDSWNSGLRDRFLWALSLVPKQSKLGDHDGEQPRPEEALLELFEVILRKRLVKIRLSKMLSMVRFRRASEARNCLLGLRKNSKVWCENYLHQTFSF